MTQNCISCGKETDNPKFCGKSCAAKHNNRVAPKRHPEGHCEKCKTAIPRQQRYCGTCKKISADEQDRQKRNIRTWQDLHGKDYEASIERFSISKKVVFEPISYSAGKMPLPFTISCGEFLDFLIGICFAKPEYLRPEDACRHIVLLSELKERVTKGPCWKPCADQDSKAIGKSLELCCTGLDRIISLRR